MTKTIIAEKKVEIREAVLSAAAKLVADGVFDAVPLPDFLTDFKTESESKTAAGSHGDFAVNAALVFAKTLRQPPRKVAELLLPHIEKNVSGIAKFEIAGPGFINLTADESFWNSGVAAVLNDTEDCYGRLYSGRGKTAIVEFVSANPTGPMHIGNARGGALGDVLASVLDFAGYKVTREFYVNDSGNQIEKLAVSLLARYKQEQGETVEFPEDGYKGEDVIQLAKGFIESCKSRKIEGFVSEEALKKALVSYAIPENLASIEGDLLKYRIVYDVWFRESQLHNSGAVAEITEKLKNSGKTYEKDGALWFKGSEYTEQFGVEKDFVLIRENGVPTYIMPDLAYHYDKLVTRGFDLAVNIWGADHHGYAGRIRAALSALGVPEYRLKIILMQLVQLVSGNELIRQSKRSGKAITLATLLDEVPVDAARFFFNLKDPDTHLNFDLDLAIEESSKNPVFYAQYAHARICTLLNKLEDDGITAEIPADGLVYAEDAEKTLIKAIMLFPEVIRDSAKSLNPSKITRYAAQVASSFHKFYDSCRIKGEERRTAVSRACLAKAVQLTLRKIFDILKVEAPKKM